MLLFYLQLIETEEDKKLFEELYYAYRKQMVYLANSILKNKDLAEDATHDAFKGIANNMTKVRNKNVEDVKNYVLRAAQNAAITILGEEKKYIGIEDLDEEIIMVEDNTLIELCNKEALEIVVQAILQVKEPYRTVLSHRFLMEMEYSEIAEVLERSPDTVRQQLHRGKAKLYQALKGKMAEYV